jgi:hypothetical protein
MDEWDVTYIPWDKYRTGEYTDEDKVLERVSGPSIVNVAERWANDGRIVKIELVER